MLPKWHTSVRDSDHLEDIRVVLIEVLTSVWIFSETTSSIVQIIIKKNLNKTYKFRIRYLGNQTLKAT